MSKFYENKSVTLYENDGNIDTQAPLATSEKVSEINAHMNLDGWEIDLAISSTGISGGSIYYRRLVNFESSKPQSMEIDSLTERLESAENEIVSLHNQVRKLSEISETEDPPGSTLYSTLDSMLGGVSWELKVTNKL